MEISIEKEVEAPTFHDEKPIHIARFYQLVKHFFQRKLSNLMSGFHEVTIEDKS